MSGEDNYDGETNFRKSPTGPAVAAPRMPNNPPTKPPPPPPVRMAGHRRRYWSVAIFVLLISGVLIRAYRDLSRPDAWDYWKDQYVSPSLDRKSVV